MSELSQLYKLTGLEPDELADALSENPRAYMAVKGAVAEKHLEKYLNKQVGLGKIQSVRKGDGDFEKDFYITANDNSEKIVECKNVEVIEISRANVIREFIAFCVEAGHLTSSYIYNLLCKNGIQTRGSSFEQALALLNGVTLKKVLQLLPKEIRQSGLPRYEFSASKLRSLQNVEDSGTYLNQFAPGLTIDFQRTRNSTDEAGDTKAQRFYRVGEIHIVAACLFSRSLEWQFVFGSREVLTLHRHYSDRYSNSLTIDPEKWHTDISVLM